MCPSARPHPTCHYFLQRIETHITLLMKGHILTQHAVKRDKEYVVNIQHVVKVLQQRAVESIIYNKFGQLGARIVRILLDKKLVEDKQVCCEHLCPTGPHDQSCTRQTFADRFRSSERRAQHI